MKKLIIVALTLLLGACASVTKVDTGTRTVGERMSMTIDAPWNHVDFPGTKPGELWTMEGIAVDEFRIYSGIKNNEVMHHETFDRQRKSFAFRSAMQTDEIVAMFEGIVTRDQSSFTLNKLEAYPFASRKGFRFEFSRVRKSDSVQQRGIGYGVIDKGELFAMVYIAPRLTYFDKYLPRVEAIVRSVHIR